MDNMTFEDSISFNVFVLEPEVKVSKPAAVQSTFEVLKLATETKCGICMGKVKPGIEIIRCSCGKEYHVTCGKRFGKCTGCSLEFKDHEEKAKDDEIGDLGAAPSIPKPEPAQQPVPATQAPPAPVPQDKPEDKPDAAAEEPKKVAKKKVALKF